MIYEIFEANVGALLARVQKLNARLTRLGAATATIKTRSTRDVPRRGQPNLLDRVVTLEVTTAAPATADGWAFVAKIIHTADGNIINHIPGTRDLPVGYREGSPRCDHCKTNRLRRDTYVVSRGDETKQVGSSCLEEFLSIKNPQTLCAAMEMVVELHDACETASKIGQPVDRSVTRLPLMRFLSYVAEITLTDGRYITRSAGGAGATATRAEQQMFAVVYPVGQDVPSTIPVRPEALSLAEAARQFVLNKFAPEFPDLDDPTVDIKAVIMSKFSKNDGLTDFEHNLYTVARAESIETRLCGIAGYIIEYYRRANNEVRPVTRLDAAGLSRIFAMFETAAKRLKRPSIRLADENIRLHLSLAKAASKNAGSIYVKADSSFDAEYYGKITADGRWFGVRTCPAEVEPLLLAFAASPEEIAAKYGKMTGCCSFCGRGLSDKRSIEVGYGPVCADKFGLTWGKLDQQRQEFAEAQDESNRAEVIAEVAA